MTRIAFTVPGPPRGKQRARTVRTKNGHSRSYTPDETTRYENLVLLCYRAAAHGRLPHDGPVQLTVVSGHVIPASWSEKKRAAADKTLCTSKPDADNILKIVADALNGVAWTDDSRIAKAAIAKCYSLEPGLAVIIEYGEAGQTVLPFVLPE